LKTYQTIVVIDSLLKSEEIDAIIEKILRIINNNGGKVIDVIRWEKKRLAYEIKRRQYGYYVEIIFESENNIITILEREYRLDEHILRYLTIRLDKKALAYMEQQRTKKQKETEEEELPDIPEIIEDSGDEVLEPETFEAEPAAAPEEVVPDQKPLDSN